MSVYAAKRAAELERTGHMFRREDERSQVFKIVK